MALMRVFSKVDADGRIIIPRNVRWEIGIEKGQLVEIKVSGTNKAQYIVNHKRKQAR